MRYPLLKGKRPNSTSDIIFGNEKSRTGPEKKRKEGQKYIIIEKIQTHCNPMAISHISGKADVSNKLDINVTNFAKLECLRQNIWECTTVRILGRVR